MLEASLDARARTNYLVVGLAPSQHSICARQIRAAIDQALRQLEHDGGAAVRGGVRECHVAI